MAAKKRKKKQTDCLRCERLERQPAKLTKTVEELEAELAKTKDELAKATKNSRNSSKPPSSDIVNPSPKDKPDQKGSQQDQGKRKKGGQPGHTRHERTPFQPAPWPEDL